MVDFTIQTTAGWLAGTRNQTSTDSDNLLHFGLVANMAAVPTGVTPSTAIVSWAYGAEASVAETATNQAAIFRSALPVDITKPFYLESKIRVGRTSTYEYFIPFTTGVFQSATQPIITTATAFNPSTRAYATFRVYEGNISLSFRNPADMGYSWNGSVWVNTSSPAHVGTYNAFYIYKMISDGTYVKWRLENSVGTLITETSWVPWTSIKNTGTPFWLVIGDPYNNSEYGQLGVEYYYFAAGEGSWASAAQTIGAGAKLGSLTISHSGLTASSYISKVEILKASDDSVLSTHSTHIISGATTTLDAGDFDNGFDSTVGTPFKVKIYYTNADYDTGIIPTISSIEGTYIPFSVEPLPCYSNPDQAEYYENSADLDITEVRADYQFIWGKNLMQTELIRERNPQAGDYFHEDEDGIELRAKIWMNIQGIASDAYKRIEQGLITPEAKLHAYVTWDTCVQNLDVIKVGKYLYRIENHNKSMYGGQTAFQEFDLLRIDHTSSTIGGGCNG